VLLVNNISEKSRVYKICLAEIPGNIRKNVRFPGETSPPAGGTGRSTETGFPLGVRRLAKTGAIPCVCNKDVTYKLWFGLARAGKISYNRA
jgi:hypothetical protein